MRRADSPSTGLLRAGGRPRRRPRLWFVHDLQGSAYRVRHLAAALGADQPVWSFESPLLAGEPNRFGPLDDVRGAYCSTDLLAVQPEGPYWLAGYSFGGICAYEMARQLRRDGARGRLRRCRRRRARATGGRAGASVESPFRPWFGVAKPPPGGRVAREQRRATTAGWSAAARSGRPGTSWCAPASAAIVDPLRFRSDLRRHGRVRPEWRLWYAWEEHWKLAATRLGPHRRATTGGSTCSGRDAPGRPTPRWAGARSSATCSIHRFERAGATTTRSWRPAAPRRSAPCLRSVIDDRARPNGAGA